MTGSLYVLLAKDAERAVIFRRGPSRQVRLISWDTSKDTFAGGQWLKGRIYERRCDLSPDGSLLVYFAANHKPPFGTWTAISRPPYLTALAVWPKGDAWGGGGAFTRRGLRLNHPAYQTQLAEGFTVPKRFVVEPFSAASGTGEDTPVWFDRLVRHGWEPDGEDAWSRRHPGDAGRMLRMRICGYGEPNGRWIVTEYEVAGERALGRCEWADWSHTGDLLHSNGPLLYRNGVQIADFSQDTFANVAAPSQATRW